MSVTCPHCGAPNPRRTFRLENRYCVRCGKLRLSVSKLNNLVRARILFYGVSFTAFIDYFFNVPFLVSIPLLGIPLAVLLWTHYTPFTEHNVPQSPRRNG